MKILATTFLVATCFYACDAARVLLVFPMPGKSHSILGDGVARHLLDAGHEVTYITPFPKNSTNPMLHEIDVSSNLDLFPHEDVSIKQVLENRRVEFNFNIISLFTKLTTYTIANENVKRLLEDVEQQFDVVIVQWLYSTSNIGFAATFNCPFIYFSTTEVNFAVLKLIDEVPNPAYFPVFLTTHVQPSTLWQRFKDLAVLSILELAAKVYFEPADEKSYSLFAPYAASRGRTLPPHHQFKYNASLMLGNSHVSLGLAYRLPQSYKEVGGFHIEPNTKPLPKDLLKILDNAKDGFIYFSMGSNLKGKDWPLVLKEDLLKMFSTLKQTVIWKFEEDLPNIPANVHILKWAPQQSILAHHNCRIFITHGGQLSTIETTHFGVPIIGIPVYGDQNSNIDRVVQKGLGIRVDLSYHVSNDLKKAIEEMLVNPRYTNIAKSFALVYHDRPSPPGKELAHWVAHVIKTRGAPHLRSPALNVPLYQKYYLDLIALIIMVGAAVKIVLKKVLCSKKVNVSKKNN